MKPRRSAGQRSRSPDPLRRASFPSSETDHHTTGKMRLSLVFLAFVAPSLILTPVPATGQDAEDEPDRWATEVAFALNTSGGNERLTILTSEVGLSHLETSLYEASFGARFRYGRSEGVEVAQNLRGSATVDLWPQAGWSPFLFATAENDPFKKLEARLNGGAGVKRTFWQEEWSEVSLSGAVLYSYENLEVIESLGNGVSETARWSWRGRARRQFGEGRRLEQIVFYQPEWDEFGDYLLESHTSGRWSLTRSLAFFTTFIYERDSTPAPEVGPEDWSLAVGLTLATRW